MDDLEAVLHELYIDHDLQHGNVIAIVDDFSKVHFPEHLEVYDADDSNPVMLRGHKSDVKKWAKKL